MKTITSKINEAKKYEFENTKLVNMFLKLGKNEKYKNLGIKDVSIGKDKLSEDELSITIQTKNATHVVYFDMYNYPDEPSYSIEGRTLSSNYKDLDYALKNLFNSWEVNKWEFELDEDESSNENVVDEVMKNINDEAVGAKFEFLKKLRDASSSYIKEAERLECFDEAAAILKHFAAALD